MYKIKLFSYIIILRVFKIWKLHVYIYAKRFFLSIIQVHFQKEYHKNCILKYLDKCLERYSTFLKDEEKDKKKQQIPGKKSLQLRNASSDFKFRHYQRNFFRVQSVQFQHILQVHQNQHPGSDNPILNLPCSLQTLII